MKSKKASRTGNASDLISINSKNKSRVLDYEWTESKLAKRYALREVYKNNFQLWARECVKIIDRDASVGASLIPFVPTASQLALLGLREEVKRFNLAYSSKLHAVDPKHPISELPIEVVCLKARKVHVSTLIQLLMFHKCEFFDHSNCLTVAHQQVSARNIAKISLRVHRNWDNKTEPPLRIPLVRVSDDLVEWDESWESRIIVMTAGSQNQTSRSFTYHMLHLSEAASYPNASSEVAAAETAASTYREIFTESTANGEGNFFHDEFTNALTIEEAWDLLNQDLPFPDSWNKKFKWFWAWWQDGNYRVPVLPHEERQIHKTLSDRERELIRDFDLDYAQLKWRRSKIRGECSKQSQMAPEEYFDQEYPDREEVAFLARSSSPFPMKQLKSMKEASRIDKPLHFGHLEHQEVFDLNNKSLPIWEFKPSGYEEGATFWQWEEPREDSQYVIGCDVSEGLPWGDWSVAVVFDRTDGTFLREAARLIIKTDPEELGEMLVYLARLYNDAFVNCERNKDGSATNIKMVRLEYPHIYHGRDEEQFKAAENPKAFTAGFLTSPKTKRLLVSRGVTSMKDGLILVRHQESIKQWMGFKKKDDGSYGSEDGKNDDCVMADLLAIWGDEEGPPVVGKRLKEPVRKELPPEQAHQEWLRERVKKIIERDRERNSRNEGMRLALSEVEIRELLG